MINSKINELLNGKNGSFEEQSRRYIMEYVIGIILVIIVVIIAGLLFRKRLYDSIDDYENWKIDIMGRNVASELTKVKALKLEGEAKEKFDHWKDEWDTILMRDLAGVEELLFDAEHAADRFRMRTARKHLIELESRLVEIEQKIEQLLTEINNLLETEKQNREKVDKLEPQLNELHKKLTQNRFQYERAAAKFEERISDTKEDILIYKALMEAGAYSEASEVVEKIFADMKQIEEHLEQFPSLYKKCKIELPDQLDELYKGIEEMTQSGYNIEHLNLSKMIKEYQARLIDFVIALENLNIENVTNLLPETEEGIQEMFKMLENEAIAKNYIESKSATFIESVKELDEQFVTTKEEVGELKLSYHFEDEDLEKYMTLEKLMEQLKEDHAAILKKIEENNYAHSMLRDELEESISRLEKFEVEHEHFKEMIHNLRKDEIEAREQIETMTEAVNKIKRKLRQSNLPGIPNFVLSMLDEAAQKNDRVIAVLEKKPLDILEVQKALNEAKVTVDGALDKTNTMLDQARLTEQVIQYANRYRSRDPILAAKLLEAEQFFHQSEYELALEQAASAVEEVEPGALKKIEQIYESIQV